jgi:hypothetical protein
MGKERAGIQQLVVVDLPPLEGGGPGGVTFLGQRVCRRASSPAKKCHFSKNDAIPWQCIFFPPDFLELTLRNFFSPAYCTRFHPGEEKVT